MGAAALKSETVSAIARRQKAEQPERMAKSRTCALKPEPSTPYPQLHDFISEPESLLSLRCNVCLAARMPCERPRPPAVAVEGAPTLCRSA
jgi:hypothetical protein